MLIEIRADRGAWIVTETIEWIGMAIFQGRAVPDSKENPTMDSNDTDDESPASFASPPCFLHELDPAFATQTGAMDAQRVPTSCAGARRSVS